MSADPTVFLNGSYMKLSEAKVPVLDRGFIFGDGVYDVVPVYGRRMFRAQEHMARLASSLSKISIANPYSKEEWIGIVDRVIESSDENDQLVYIQVTRGAAPRLHAFPKESTPTVFVMSNPLPMPSAEARSQGVACVTMPDERWLHCDIKSVSLLGNVLAAQHAAAHNAAESIMFRDGILTEASSSNVWVVKDGTVIGPKKDHRVLEGIRYGLLETLCKEGNIPFQMRDIAQSEVFGADEILLTSAAKEVLPVTHIDGKPVGAGVPGPIYAKLYALYQTIKAL